MLKNNLKKKNTPNENDGGANKETNIKTKNRISEANYNVIPSCGKTFCWPHPRNNISWSKKLFKRAK